MVVKNDRNIFDCEINQHKYQILLDKCIYGNIYRLRKMQLTTLDKDFQLPQVRGKTDSSR